MGLAERRAAKQFETDRLPKLKQELEAAAGFPVQLEINWESMATEGESHLYDESWTQVYFQPLVKAFREIAVDDMGREALKGGLRKVILQNVGGFIYGESGVQFEGGVLTFDHKSTTNVDDVDERAKAIREKLEAKL